jgi:hypothetical protein
MLAIGPTEIGGAFDFSAPTVDQSPNFTVRIRGSFLSNPDDPTFSCHWPPSAAWGSAANGPAPEGYGFGRTMIVDSMVATRSGSASLIARTSA